MPIICATDDGYYNNKGYAGKGKALILPTHAKVGRSTALSMTGSLDLHTYATKDTEYGNGETVVTVGRDLREFDPIDFGDYPTSTINRIVVNHFLKTFLGKDATEPGVFLVTGLPMKDFYTKSLSEINEVLIAKKMENLKSPVYAYKDEERIPVAKILQQDVISEGIAAHYDFVFDENMKTGEITLNQDKATDNNVYVDIGGRTTDVAYLEEGKIINKNVSGSLPVGMLNFRDEVINRVAEMLSIDKENFSVKQVNKMLNEGTIKVDGRTHDVGEIVSESKSIVAQTIMNDVKKRLKGSRTADNLIFVGGGASFLEDAIKATYAYSLFPEDGILANARGMYKSAKFQADNAVK